MPRKRTSPEENIHKLREAEILIAQGQTVREAAKQIGVTEQTSTFRLTEHQCALSINVTITTSIGNFNILKANCH